MENDPRFGEVKISELPVGLFETLLEQAFNASHDFFLSLVLDDKLTGSGTLIDAWGTLGILTAYHVAAVLDSNPTGSLCSPLAGFAHRFEIPRECIEHIPLGKPDRRVPEKGPDISFLKLSDGPAVATLKSKKSFYRVADKDFEVFRKMGFEKLFWWIAGAPAEKSRPMTSKSAAGALMASHFIAQVAVKSLTIQDGGDLLNLAGTAGQDPFPKEYGGASGGAVWVSSLMLDAPDADLSTLEISPCHLAGVIFYQGETDDTNSSTEIIANGPRTLASSLEQFRGRARLGAST